MFHTNTELVAFDGVPVLEPVDSASHRFDLPSLIGLVVASKQPDVSAGIVTSTVDTKAQLAVLITPDGTIPQGSWWLYRPGLVTVIIALTLLDICTEFRVSLHPCRDWI